MIIYYKCTCTTADRLRVKKLKEEGYEVRLTKNPQWRQEAAKYNVSVPFKVVDEVDKIGVPL
jgi:hypothetical protein